MIILNSPKGWTGPKVVGGFPIEGTFRAHQVPLHPRAHPEHLELPDDDARRESSVLAAHRTADAEKGVLLEMNLCASVLALLAVFTPMVQQGVVTEPPVEVEYDREYDFSRLKSYAWSPEQEPASNQADHIRIVKAISERLKMLGFDRDGKKQPDVHVSYTLAVEQKKLHVDSRQRPSEWDPTDLETTLALGGHEEAYLVVEMYDSATDKRVWRAKCAHAQPTPDKVERSLYQTVEHLFETYPGKAEPKK